MPTCLWDWVDCDRSGTVDQEEYTEIYRILYGAGQWPRLSELTYLSDLPYPYPYPYILRTVCSQPHVHSLPRRDRPSGGGGVSRGHAERAGTVTKWGGRTSILQSISLSSHTPSPPTTTPPSLHEQVAMTKGPFFQSIWEITDSWTTTTEVGESKRFLGGCESNCVPPEVCA